jgi:hypothetical protein
MSWWYENAHKGTWEIYLDLWTPLGANWRFRLMRAVIKALFPDGSTFANLMNMGDDGSGGPENLIDGLNEPTITTGGTVPTVQGQESFGRSSRMILTVPFSVMT